MYTVRRKSSVNEKGICTIAHQVEDVVKPLTDIEKFELKERIYKSIQAYKQQKKDNSK
jgi:hypothetical protein